MIAGFHETLKRYIYIYLIDVHNVYIYIFIKGSLDEKLPSYELLKCLKVTVPQSNSSVK